MTSRVPPCSDFESPSAETVTSSRVPCVEKAGRFAVTMTAATLAVRRLAPRVLTPRRSSIACSDCLVKGALLRRVAGAVEADHEAIADELVLAHALDRREILDARERRRGRRRRDQGRRAKGYGELAKQWERSAAHATIPFHAGSVARSVPMHSLPISAWNIENLSGCRVPGPLHSGQSFLPGRQ